MANLNGKMAENMKASIKMTRNMDMGYLIGQMGGNTKDVGKMENNKAKGSISVRMALKEKENG